MATDKRHTQRNKVIEPLGRCVKLKNVGLMMLLSRPKVPHYLALSTAAPPRASCALPYAML